MKKCKWQYLFKVSILAIIVFVLTVSVSAFEEQALNHESIDDESREIMEISGESLKLGDCPEDWQKFDVSRVIIQVIDNVFHKWKEIECTDSGELFLVLKKPEYSELSAKDAEALLEASAQWEEQYPDMEDLKEAYSLDPSDPTLDVPPILDPYQGENIEAVIGTDERVKVSRWGVNNYPWNTIGYMLLQWPGDNNYRGTGFLVAPNLILTNAHNVYNEGRSHTGYVDEILFAPGQYQEGDKVHRDFGFRASSNIIVEPRYIDEFGPYSWEMTQYDYAAVFLDEPFWGINTFMPLMFNYEPGAINTSGYPGEAHGERTWSQWRSFDRVHEDTPYPNRILGYYADTSPGHSGSPVWVFFRNPDRRYVVAVHARRDSPANNYNAGPRLASHNMNIIESWFEQALWLGPPTRISPRHNSDTHGTSVQFQWQKVTTAENYQIQVFNPHGSTRINREVGNTSQATFHNFPENGATFQWRMRTQDASGNWGLWSDRWNFTSRGAAPVELISPANHSEVFGSSVQFRWNRIIGAKNYQIDIFNPDGSLRIRRTLGDSTQATFQNFPENGATFRWRVRAQDVSGNWGPWSDNRYFTSVDQGFLTNFGTAHDPSYQGWIRRPADRWNLAQNIMFTRGWNERITNARYGNNHYTDFDFTVRMRRLNADWTRNAVIIRSGGLFNYLNRIYPSYIFGYHNNGRYNITRYNWDGSVTWKQYWTDSTAINNNGFNDLKVRVVGNTYRFYINNVLVNTVRDNAFRTSGMVGFHMYRSSDDPRTTRYDVSWARLVRLTQGDLVLDEVSPEQKALNWKAMESMKPDIVYCPEVDGRVLHGSD